MRAVARISTQIPLDAWSNLRNSTLKNLNETPPGTARGGANLSPNIFTFFPTPTTPDRASLAPETKTPLGPWGDLRADPF